MTCTRALAAAALLLLLGVACGRLGAPVRSAPAPSAGAAVAPAEEVEGDPAKQVEGDPADEEPGGKR